LGGIFRDGVFFAPSFSCPWNDLLTPLILLNDDSLWTLPLGTMQFQGQYGQDLALIAAFVTMAALPTIIFYLVAEKQIVSGLTAGAVKG
jgi:raffinose/stachyose/melibiose transport system permease protein